MDPLILVVLDGLNAKTAFENMGYLESLLEEKRCARYSVRSQLPAMSRPLYETIQTGLRVNEHKILNNETTSPSKEEVSFP